MNVEILGIIVGAAAASVAAASVISAVKEWLNRKMKIKLKFAGVELEIPGKDKSSIYNKIVSEIIDLKIHPKVFIIYPHFQKEFAKKLTNDLSQAGITVWLDENELKPGDKIMHKIKNALKESQWVILVPPPEGREGSWVNKEIEVAYEEEKERARPFIIPLKVNEGKIPSVFEDRLWVDFSDKYKDGIESLLNGIIRVPHHGSEKTEKDSNNGV